MKTVQNLSLIGLTTLCLCLTTTAYSDEAAPTTKIGIVNFKKCAEESKLGQAEQKEFDALKKKMETALADKEKELSELANKLNDTDYRDGLSPEAENELKHKFRTLGQEFQQHQQQYYQALQQANFKIVQKLSENVANAAKAVAKQKGLDLVLNEETTFFHNPTLDMTKLVIAVMDKIQEKSK